MQLCSRLRVMWHPSDNKVLPVDRKDLLTFEACSSSYKILSPAVRPLRSSSLYNESFYSVKLNNTWLK